MVRKLLAPLLLAACAASQSAPPPAGPTVLPSAERDYDGDGIVDPRDRCPREPGDAPLGCPDKDVDGDGLKASVDKCPNFAGPPPTGCPPPDADNDGVGNDDDKCQGKFETPNGFQDNDGCPDEIPRDLARYIGTVKGVTFEGTTDTLKASANVVLDRVIKLLKRYTDVRIEISAHTDNLGDRETGNDLTALRADSVKDYLTEHGIDAARLETRGAGANEPLDSNKTAAGRARNNRIEFTILVP